MAFSDYQNTYAWQAAMELGPKLTMLSEELPSAEQNGLGQALLNLALDLPTAIGADIQTGSTSRFAVLIKLQTALELTGRIYPALDNGAVENALAAKMDRFTGDTFAEMIPAPAAPEVIPETEEVAAEVVPSQPLVPSAAFVAQQASAALPTMPPTPNPIETSTQVAGLDTSGTHISLTP